MSQTPPQTPKQSLTPPPPPNQRSEDKAFYFSVMSDFMWVKILLWAILIVNIGSCVNTCSTSNAVNSQWEFRFTR